MDNYKYDVALSFAGEQRKYVEGLAQRLSDCGIKVYLDSWNIESTWGKDLTAHFGSVFPNEAMYVIAIFSKEYIEKAWPRFEFEMMQYRQISEEEFILPIAFDGTFPQNWPKTRGYLDANDYSIDDIALIIRNKVFERKVKAPEKDTESKEEISPRRIMTITGEDGKAEQVEVILAYQYKEDNKEFVIYTKNEIDSHGNTTIYVSHVDRTSGSPRLMGVDDADWGRVRQVLWELSQGDSDSGLQMPLKPFIDKDGNEIL